MPPASSIFLDLLGLVLVDAFLDRLGSAFDQRLCLAEAKVGDRADFLDHVDLLAAVAGEDDVEFGLLFGGRAGGGGGGRSGCDSRGGGNAPLLFERLGEIRGLEDGQFGKLVDQLVMSAMFYSLAGRCPGFVVVIKNVPQAASLAP